MIRPGPTVSVLLVSAALGLSAPRAAVAQDAEAGQRVFNQCRACHVVQAGGRNLVGPNLHGAPGRQAGQVEGFRYSANMVELAQGGLTWDDETLARYLANPREVVPRGSMAFPGLRNPQQVQDVIAYLKQQSAGS